MPQCLLLLWRSLGGKIELWRQTRVSLLTGLLRYARVKKKKTKTKLLEVTATAVSAAPTSFSVLPRVIISGYFYLLNLFALLHAVFFQVTATSIKYSTLAICLAIPAKALKTEMFKITLTLHQY